MTLFWFIFYWFLFNLIIISLINTDHFNDLLKSDLLMFIKTLTVSDVCCFYRLSEPLLNASL